MANLRNILTGSVAMVSLAALPVLAQDAGTTLVPGDEIQQADSAQNAPPGEPRPYDEVYGGEYAELGERDVQELVGTDVINDTGEEVGEIASFGLAGDQLVAIVGVGGFLGMGEQRVAIPLDQMTFDGERLLLSGVTRDQLEQMPEYDEATTRPLAETDTFRAGYDTGIAGGIVPPQTEVVEGGVAGETEPMLAEATAEDDTVQAEPEEVPERMVESGEVETLSETDTVQAEADINPLPDVETETAAAEVEPGVVEATEETGWTQQMDQTFGEIADQQVADLVGMEVASAEGEVIGEVDNFALMGEEVVAVVGIGGFLGIGQHDIALSLGELTFDGERLVVSLGEEQLREMPEFDETAANYVRAEGTLRGSYDQ